MRLVIVIMTVCLMQASAASFAQKISLSKSNVSLKSVLKDIKVQSGMDVVYADYLLADAKPVSVDLKNVAVEDALKAVLRNQALSFKITGSTIVLLRREKLTLERIKDTFAAMDVRGKVVDDKGEPMVGASISLKAGTQKTMTGVDGTFVLRDVPGEAIIVVTFIGYKTRELKAERDLGTIVLEIATSTLDQVKIQGYGTTTQRLSTGNIGTVTSQIIGQQAVTNPLQALSGRVAGVQITQTSGIPGSGINIQIRGRNSIGASNNPLFIVDGVPFVSEDITAGMQLSTISPLNSISPNDIESISVLKDADATAIYGSRAANGVVLITTKSGASGKDKLDVNFNRAYSSVTRTAQVMSTSQYLQMRRDAFANSATTPTNTTAPDLLLWDQSLDNNMVDWYMGNTADVWDAGASFSGGNKQTQFLVSGNFHQENTMFSDDDKFERGNIHFSLKHTSQNEKLKLKFSGIYASDNNKVQNIAAATANTIAQTVPNYPYFDNNGNFNWVANQLNYYASATAYTRAATQNLNLSVNGDYVLTKEFKLSFNIGYSKLSNETMRPQPAISKNPVSANPLGSNIFLSTDAETYLFEPQLNYNYTILGGSLTFLLGSTIQKRNTNTSQIVVSNYLTDLSIESMSGGTVGLAASTNRQYNFLSGFARANFNWKDRYILNASFRRDGSSRFGPDRRFGNFGSIGAAWIFSNESLFSDKALWLSYGKFRGSYGSTGSDGIGDYGYLSLYGFTSDYGTQKALIPYQIANNDFQWESTKKLEFALDVGFFDDRLLFTTAWYHNKSGNQLVTYPLPGTTGFTGYISNLPALVKNSGWEFELNTQNLSKSQFTWSTALNLTIPRNNLLEFPNIAQTSYANTHVVGKPLNLFLGYQFANIDPQTGVSSVVDISGNGVISANSAYNERGGDKIYVGTTDPKWFAGLNNSFGYKGISVDVFFQYTKQNGYNLFSTQNGFSGFGTLRNGFTAYQDYWKNPGDLSQIPKPFANTNTTLSQFSQSDKTFSDASYLRLKTLAINYTLPKQWLSRTGMQNTQVFALGQNLWTATDYLGQDPEQASFNSVRQPSLQTFSFGIKSTF